MKDPGRTLPLFAAAYEPRRGVGDVAGEVQRRVNEADVGVRLREVAQLPASRGVDHLCEEAEVVGAAGDGLVEEVRARSAWPV